MRFRTALAACSIIVVGPSVGAFVASGTAGAQVDSTSEAARELAERHAPIVMIATQDGPCDDGGEPFRPMSVDVVLDNDDVLLRQAGEADPIVRRGPDAADLFGRGDGFFLDLNGIALDPKCVYERDLDRYAAGDRDVLATV